MTTPRGQGLCLLIIIALLGPAAAQDPTLINVPGNTVVYNSAAASAQSYSDAYIDASVFYYPSEAVDICHVINNILRKQYSGVGYPAAGAVVDARGILEGNNATLCNVNPFDGITGSFNTTLLLPAATIRTACPWILPSGTHVVGEGRGMSGIALQSTFVPSTNNAVLEMGSAGWTNTNCSPNTSYVCPSTGCTGISIEHLTISPEVAGGGSDNPYTAIYNNYATDLSYIDDVVLQNVGQTTAATSVVTGLFIGPGATYSGPYANIDFVASAPCSGFTCQYTACVQIQAQTRGVHGITCTAASQGASVQPFAAIYVDSYNDSVSDVHVEGFYDGVVVGDYQNTGSSVPIISGNTISNITVAHSNSGPVSEAVHICNPASTSQPANTACKHVSTWTSSDLTDVAVLGILTNGAGLTPAITPLTDDLTATSITASTGREFLASYALGDPISVITGTGGSNIYSKFTSTQGATGFMPTWGVGSETPSTGCASPGALYSNTSGGTNTTLYICNSSGTWVPIG